MLGNEPKTKEEAAKYRYNVWGGSPRGTAYDAARCAMEVYEKGRSMMFYQCLRKPGYGPDGLYCKQHAKKVQP